MNATTSSSPTASPTACTPSRVDDVAIWVFFAVALLLAVLAPALAKLLLVAVRSLALKRATHSRRFVLSIFALLERLLLGPISLLLTTLFIWLALDVCVPWPRPTDCTGYWPEASRLQYALNTILLIFVFCFSLFAIKRFFDFLYAALDASELSRNDPRISVVCGETVTAVQLILVVVLAFIFFFAVMERILPNEFNYENFGALFVTPNIITLLLVALVVPMLRDTLGGLSGLVDGHVRLGDVIEIGDFHGTVVRLGLFSVAVRGIDGSLRLVSPGLFLTEPVVVYEKALRRGGEDDDDDEKKKAPSSSSSEVIKFQMVVSKADREEEESARSLAARVERSLEETLALAHGVSVALRPDGILEVRFECDYRHRHRLKTEAILTARAACRR